MFLNVLLHFVSVCRDIYLYMVLMWRSKTDLKESALAYHVCPRIDLRSTIPAPKTGFLFAVSLAAAVLLSRFL